MSMRIKKGDTVLVVSGSDKGKKGKVLKAFPKALRLIVEGVHIRKKHQRATRANQKGQLIDKTMPIHVSNVMLLDPSAGKPTRVGKRLVGERYVRIAKKSGSTL